MSYFARFRSLHIIILAGPEFCTARDYGAVQAVMQQFKTATKQQQAVNARQASSELRLSLSPRITREAAHDPLLVKLRNDQD